MLCVNIDKLYELQGEMNETQMAKKLGISRSQLWRIKTGHSSVGQEFIAKFKKSFPEIRIDDIFLFRMFHQRNTRALMEQCEKKKRMKNTDAAGKTDAV